MYQSGKVLILSIAIASIALLAVAQPTITTQPASQDLCVGGSLILEVGAVGANLSYQWRLNAVAIPGATGSTYSIVTSTLADAGNYDVVVTSVPGGSITSETATVRVAEGLPPVVDLTPPPGSGFDGTFLCSDAIVELVYPDPGPSAGYSYRWFFESPITNGPLEEGSETSSIVVSTLPLGSGTWSVWVTNACGTSISSVYIEQFPQLAPLAGSGLLINNVEATETQAAIVLRGDRATLFAFDETFGLDVNGNEVPGRTITWYKDGEELVLNDRVYLGADYVFPPLRYALTIENVQFPDTGIYSYVYTDLCSSYSGRGKLAVECVLDLAMTFPDFRGVCIGDPVQFTATTASTEATFQWQFNGVDIPGATNSVYTIASAMPSDAGQYDLAFRDGACQVVDLASFPLNVIEEPPTGPANFAIAGATTGIDGVYRCNGELLVLSPDGGDGEGDLNTYQWFRDGNLVGTERNYTLTDADFVGSGPDAAEFTLRITNACGSFTTNPTQVTNSRTLPFNFTNSGTITPGPSNSFFIGEGITLRPLAIQWSNTGIVTASWTKNGIPITSGGRFTVGDVTSNPSFALRISKAEASDAGTYTFTYIDACTDTSISTTLQVSQAPPPTILTQPTGRQICLGEPLTLTVAATGFGVSYQWRLNGSTIPDATAPTYVVAVTSEANEGNYDVVVADTLGGVAFSNAAFVQIVTAPEELSVGLQGATFIDTVDGETQFYVRCPVNQSLTFSPVIAGGEVEDFVYRWFIAGMLASTEASFQVPAPVRLVGSEVTLLATNACGTFETTVVVMEYRDYFFFTLPEEISLEYPLGDTLQLSPIVRIPFRYPIPVTLASWTKDEQPLATGRISVTTEVEDDFLIKPYTLTVEGVLPPNAGRYTFRFVDVCSDTLASVNVSVAVAEPDLQPLNSLGFWVFPNPFGEQLTLEGPEVLTEPITLRLFNSQGGTCWERTYPAGSPFGRQLLPTATLSVGTYYLRVETPTQAGQDRLVRSNR